MEEYPNWPEMPQELMSNILQRLGTKEIMESARKVCTTWRRICKNSDMWKVIIMRADCEDVYHLERLTKQAVDLSSGDLIEITLHGFGNDDLIDYIVRRSCKLKSLCLRDWIDITGSRFSQAVKWVPQLEELYISYISINTEDIEAIGQNCPQLKSFRVHGELTGASFNYDANAIAIANNMPQLRCLQLFDRYMTNNGLMAILDGCPHLESLHIRMYHDLVGNLRKLCMERIKDFMFHLEVEDDDYYHYSVSYHDLDYASDYSG